MNNIIYVFSLLSIILSIVSIIIVLHIYLQSRRIIRLLKIKPLTPVIRRPSRIRKRYIVFAVLSNKEFKREEIAEVLSKGFKEFLGISSLVQADPYLIYYDPRLKRGVIRVAHTFKDKTLAVFDFINKYILKDSIIIPIKTTGTIKKARKIMYKHRTELQL